MRRAKAKPPPTAHLQAVFMLYGKAFLAVLGLSRLVRTALEAASPPPPPPPPPPSPSDDLCADYVWPPEGTVFCSSNSDCSIGEVRHPI